MKIVLHFTFIETETGDTTACLLKNKFLLLLFAYATAVSEHLRAIFTDMCTKQRTRRILFHLKVGGPNTILFDCRE